MYAGPVISTCAPGWPGAAGRACLMQDSFLCLDCLTAGAGRRSQYARSVQKGPARWSCSSITLAPLYFRCIDQTGFRKYNWIYWLIQSNTYIYLLYVQDTYKYGQVWTMDMQVHSVPTIDCALYNELLILYECHFSNRLNIIAKESFIEAA